jgi:hypothetical protein
MRLRLHGLPCHKSDIEWLELKEAVPMLQFSVDELLSGDFEEAVA